jgi:hypothetical protein
MYYSLEQLSNERVGYDNYREPPRSTFHSSERMMAPSAFQRNECSSDDRFGFRNMSSFDCNPIQYNEPLSFTKEWKISHAGDILSLQNSVVLFAKSFKGHIAKPVKMGLYANDKLLFDWRQHHNGTVNITDNFLVNAHGTPWCDLSIRSSEPFTIVGWYCKTTTDTRKQLYKAPVLINADLH